MKRTLVIGDSMIKHIDQQKIQRASGDQSVVHSYSGAKVDEIKNKIKHSMEKDQFETIILHVGTNDLVHEDSEMVATKMDALIKEAKSKARHVVVSSIIKRYDSRVALSRITLFNNLMIDLCSQHNTTYLNNDHIDKSLLNRSNLHLNQNGDRALGRTFCNYLKSIRVGTINGSLSTTGSFFHKFYYNHRMRDWITYLKFVSHRLKY